jgi:cytochrome P450
MDVPEIDLAGAEVSGDPFAVYGRARERSALARLVTPGMGPLWALTRYDDIRAMLSDPRFATSAASFMRPGVPPECLPYMRTMAEMNGPEHARLRRLASPAFTPRRVAAFRPRIRHMAERLLDDVESRAGDGPVDLLSHFARPLPMDVICELAGVPGADRPRWRTYGVTVVTSAGEDFAAAVPGIMDRARAAVAHRRDEPGDDLISELIAARTEDGDRLSDTEMVTLVWHLVLAGQTPANLIANAVVALLSHPGQLSALREDPGRMPRAVEELTRWCGPTLLSIPRYAREDTELHGIPVRRGEGVTAAVAAGNRDPRVFTEPDRLDVARDATTPAHLGFAHGPHFCLGASIARVQTQVALGALLRRFPHLAPAADPAELRAHDPGNWRVTSLPVTI